MPHTSSGERAYMIAHQMQMRVAAGVEAPAHAEHIREFIDYANNLADHYYQLSTAYTDKRISEAVRKEVEIALADPKIELKVDEKSAQSAEKSVRSIFRNIFG